MENLVPAAKSAKAKKPQNPRSENLSPNEQESLLNACHKYPIIESKGNTRGVVSKQKEAWDKIFDEFKELNAGSTRNLETLQGCWSRVRDESRNKVDKVKGSSEGEGNGPPPVPLDGAEGIFGDFSLNKVDDDVYEMGLPNESTDVFEDTSEMDSEASSSCESSEESEDSAGAHEAFMDALQSEHEAKMKYLKLQQSFLKIKNAAMEKVLEANKKAAQAKLLYRRLQLDFLQQMAEKKKNNSVIPPEQQ